MIFVKNISIYLKNHLRFLGLLIAFFFFSSRALFAQTYCVSSGDLSYQDGITLVEFNAIDNATFTKTSGYNDFTSISTTLLKDNIYTLTVNINTEGNYINYARVWIDWNNDGDFEDSNEEYDLGDARNVTDGATSNSPISILVPTTASPGTTRMRVSTKYSSYPTACETGFDGEVEDYTLNIVEATIVPSCVSPSYPSDGEVGVPITALLSWDVSLLASGYKLFLGTDASATNLVNGTDQGSVTSYTPTSDLTLSTDYYWKVVPYNSLGDASGCDIWSFTTDNVLYCSSYGSTQYDDGITLVEFNAINNASPTKTSGYSDFTSIGTDLLVGDTYDLSVNLNTDGNYTNHAKAWIDWNHDGDFEDSNEEYDLGTAINVTDAATAESPKSISVPSTASLGQTRMRVSTQFGVSPTACLEGFDGEVEDYALNIIDTIPPAITASPSDTAISSALCDPNDPVFSDNYALDKVTWEMTGATTASSPSTGINYVGSSTFNEGTTTITYTASDASGNAITYSFDVFFARLQCLLPAQTGLADSVFLIQSPADLVCLSTSSFYWDKFICQLVDVDFEASSWGTCGGVTYSKGDWDFSGVVNSSDDEGFLRIGSAVKYFTGTYQGASWDGSILTLNVDRSIENLFINRNDIWGDGLFAKTKNAYIKNVHLIDVDISSRGQAGALIGYADNSRVDDCSSSGRVVVTSREVGGLIGYSNGFEIRRSSSSCTVISTTTNQLNIGGLVGKLNYSGEIINCSASGDVYAPSAGNVGGLVGFAISATIEGSYATGFVHGGTSVGGFIGYSEKSTVSNCYSAGSIIAESVAGSFAGSADKSNGTSLLEFCYATGNVALSGATSTLGAFVGYNSGTTYSACYYDEEITGAADSSLNDLSSGDDLGIIAFTTSDFAIFSNFNFSASEWNFDTHTYGRPYLAWQNDGSADYNVSNPVATPIDGGFSQDATYLGTYSVQGLRYAKIKPLAYDDFSDNAYGWDDGSSTSTWPAGDSYSGFGITSGTDMEYTHSSGISVLGGNDYLVASGTDGAPDNNQSKYVFRELEGLDETFYVSFLARFSSTVSNSWSYIALGKKDGTDDSGVALGTLGSGSKLGAAFANNGNLISRIGTSSPIGNQTYFVVGKWTCDASGNITSIDTWIDPDSPDLDKVASSCHSVIVGVSDQMSAIDIQSYYSGTSNIDEIRVGRTWSSVVPSLSAELNWIDVSPATSTSGNAFTIEQTDLDNGVYYVQPYIVKGDGSYEYGDMSCVEVDDEPIIPNISTDSVTKIGETTATFYGSISSGESIVEYGFYYSTDNDASQLVNGGTNSLLTVYDDVAINPSHINFFSDVTSLTNRSAYYFRAYMKDVSDNYTYGKVVRFLSEKRDFSLALDGDGDFLLIDSTTTHDVINDWGIDDNTFSVDFWMRNASTNIDKMVIISDTCHSGTNHMGYMIAFSHGQFYFESGGYMNKTDSVIFDQEWHHVACTYNDRTACIYVDESLIPSVYSSFTLTRPTVDINCRIGSTNPPDALSKFCYFNGNIDAMRFWNVALTLDQISELCYHNVKSNPSSNTITCIASGRVIPGLTADNLTASLGFNVMSTQESVGTVPVDVYYPSQDSLHALPFFHADTRLSSDSTSFNMVAVGDAHPSPYLPRVHWRCNPTDSVWMNSYNWGGYAYPGQGVIAVDYSDVTTSDLANDSVYCFYTIVDSSAIRPIVTGTPPEVQILVDKDERIGTYRVDESASKLTIIKGISPSMFDAADINSKDGAIDIEEGSLEAFSE